MSGRPTSSRRGRVLAVVLALLATTGALGVGHTVAATKANAVDWKQDDVAKTITATIKITLVPTCGTAQFQAAKFGGGRAAWCEVTDAIANQIKGSIEKVWNGHQYYCYDVIVKVDMKIDQDPNSSDPTDRIKIRVDQTAGSVATNTVTRNNTTGTWNGNAQSDALTPMNNGRGSSTWAYPPLGGLQDIYAHEAGHILGLHDGYTRDANGNTFDIPGAPDDLMKDEANPTVSKETIRRMVERAGFDKHKLKCNYRIDTQGNGSHVTGKKCDSTLDGQWIAKGTYSAGVADGNQQWITTISKISGVTQVTGSGDFVYSDLQKADFGAVITTTKGTAVGRATMRIDDELVAHFNLKEQAHSYTVSTNLGGKGHDQNAPLEQYEMDWQPIGKCGP